MAESDGGSPAESVRWSRLDALAEAPWELDAYERWLASSATSHDEYLFAESKARFQPADEDVLFKLDGLEVVDNHGELELVARSLSASLTLGRAPRAAVERLLELIDGRRCVAELLLLAGAERALFQRILARALGSVLFTPRAVSDLEARLSGAELVRFVNTPYELVRNYWLNMIDVRSAAEASLASVTSVAEFVTWLRRLHVLTLMGRDLSTFYRPASRIAANGARPGVLYDAATRTLSTPERTLLLAGPRVGVNLVGGPQYHALVAGPDHEALAATRDVVDENEVPWGRVVTGRALEDKVDAAWFCPPRPLSAEHFSALFGAFFEAANAAGRADHDGTVAELARFHYRFVRLHPFRCANQSLAMNLLNLVLTRSHGAGVPHLMLDHFALRLSERRYLEVFARAVAAHCVTGSAAQRWAALRAQKQRAYALIERLQRAPNRRAAEQLAAADPEAAQAALIPL